MVLAVFSAYEAEANMASSGLNGDSNPDRFRCSALPVELSGHLGADR